MSDDVLRFTYQIPLHYADYPEAAEHMQRDARRQFGEALFDRLQGGGIVGPIHTREETRTDWLFASGDYKTVTMYCNVTDLPDPPEFRLLGGPADGVIVRTNGAAIWRVPLAPPIPTVLAYGEDPTTIVPRHAEYERIGGTQTYRFLGTRPG